MDNDFLYLICLIFVFVVIILPLTLVLKRRETPKMEKEHEKLKNAAMSGDFEALCELVNNYNQGHYNKAYYATHPQHAADIFHAAEKLVEIVSSSSSTKEPELEDFYWLGLMYEEGFGTEKNKTKALEYFNKALTT